MRVAGDGVCVATTRYPEPLPGALCKVALFNGDRIPVTLATRFGGSDFGWMVPLSDKNRSATYINDKLVSESSTEMESDLRLLLSAQLVTDVCINARPATFDTWKSAGSTVRDVQKRFAAGESNIAIGGYKISLDGLISDDS